MTSLLPFVTAIYIFAFVVILIAIIATYLIKKKPFSTPPSIIKKIPLKNSFFSREFCNKNELQFLLLLRSILPPHIIICPKVGLWAIIKVDNNDIASWNRISKKHLDLIVIHCYLSRVKSVDEKGGQ